MIPFRKSIQNLSFAILTALAVGTAFVQPAQAAKSSCADTVIKPTAIVASTRLRDLILMFENLMGSGSTTSLRREDKIVVNQTAIDEQLGAMTEYAQNHETAKFRLRDQKLPGQKNITSTIYFTPIRMKMTAREMGEKMIEAREITREQLERWLLEKKQGIVNVESPQLEELKAKVVDTILSGKVRLRKYFSTDSSAPLGSAEMHPSGGTDGYQYLEFKIDHPLFKQSVVKPRVLIPDADALTLQDATTYAANRSEYARRWVDLNSNSKTPRSVTEAVVENYLAVFDDLYRSGMEKLPQFAKTEYVRDSYSLFLYRDGEDPADLRVKPLEIQFTVDQEIKVIDSRSGHSISAYSAEDVVVEIKVPVRLAKLDAKAVAEYPGLAFVAQIKAELEAQHNMNFVKGSGKLSTFRRLLIKLFPDLGDI
ncbi:MAG: hypothetical protein V4692_16680 [Bdellovibrionota bacterium]